MLNNVIDYKDSVCKHELHGSVMSNFKAEKYNFGVIFKFLQVLTSSYTEDTIKIEKRF